jgi:hypothetical protein
VVFGSQIDLEAHRLEKHSSLSNTGRKKGRKLDIGFQYTDSVSMRRRGNRDGEIGGPSAAFAESFDEPLSESTISNEYPAFGSARSRAPRGFGQLSESRPTTALSVQEIPPPPVQEPLPQVTLQLTPAQQSVFDPLVDLQSNHVLPSSEHFKKLKVLIHSFRSHSLSADQVCVQYVQLVEQLHPKIVFTNDTKATHDLITAMASLWHRMAELFIDNVKDTDRYHTLIKKQKRKGLSIHEFEELKQVTPMKQVFLNSWNDWKVKVTIVDVG